MKPRVNNPGWVQAIQDVMDLIATEGAYPADQINADPGTTGLQPVPCRHRLHADVVGRRGLERAHLGHVGRGRRGGLRHQPRLDPRYNSAAGAWEETAERSAADGLYRLGRLCHQRVSGDEKKRKAAWSRRRIWAARTCRCGLAAYPSGFQPYRNSHFNYDEWEAAGYDRAFIEDYLGSNADSYNHPNAAIEPRIPGIFQYYSVAEDELAKGYAGQYASAQETADAIAAAWEKITDQIGRDSQIALYKASWACDDIGGARAGPPDNSPWGAQSLRTLSFPRTRGDPVSS
jgi:multiple sugar transport system substrate-binding protein